MWMSTDDARSDFILAAAMTFFVPLVVSFLLNLLAFVSRIALGVLDPILTSQLFLIVVALVSLWALSGMMPLYLARYRNHGASAFGLDSGRESVGAGLLLLLPIAGADILIDWLGRPPTFGESPVRAAMGQIAMLSLDPLDLLLQLGLLVLFFAGPLLFVAFLHVRARDGFREVTVTQVEALRTFGMGAAAAGLLFGMLNAVGPSTTMLEVLFAAGGLVALVLLADRFVPAGATMSRAAAVAPGVTVLLVAIVGSGGGFFNPGTLLPALYSGSLAGGFAIVVSVLLQSRSHAWAVVPMFAAAAVYPSTLTPARTFLQIVVSLIGLRG